MKLGCARRAEGREKESRDGKGRNNPLAARVRLGWENSARDNCEVARQNSGSEQWEIRRWKSSNKVASFVLA